MRYLVIISILMLSLSSAYGQKDKSMCEGNREYNKSAFEESEVEYRRALDINPNSEKATLTLEMFSTGWGNMKRPCNFNKHRYYLRQASEGCVIIQQGNPF
ncbi:MAG: hypothetical protein R2727_06860 [Bacteroidales bacterium]